MENVKTRLSREIHAVIIDFRNKIGAIVNLGKLH